MRKILVVVDYQNDFVDGALGFEGADLLDEGIAKKVREYGEGNVIYTLDTHYKADRASWTYEEEDERWDYLNTREGRALPVEHCIRITEGWKVYGETKKALEDVGAHCIEKVTFGISPFQMDKLNRGQRFNEEEIASIEIIGLVTNMCVISNAAVFQAAYPEAQIIVDASLCASFNKELHDKALDVMEGMQVKIINRG